MAKQEDFSTVDKGKLRRLLAIVELFRELDAEIKVRWFSELLQIAIEPGDSVRGYAKKLGIHFNSASIDLLALGPMARTRQPGLGLIEKQISIDDLRRQEIKLTPKGRTLINEMLRLMPS